MPALRNRQHLMKGSSNSDGCSPQDTADLLKKKLITLEDKLNDADDNNNNNNSNYKTNNQSDDDEIFGDTKTIGLRPKFVGKSNDETIPIFGNQIDEDQSGQGIKDQFAIALLRLQQNLDATNIKLRDVETKVDAISRQNSNRQKLIERTDGKRIGLFNRDNFYTLAYLTWPVVAFVAMRAIEKKSLFAGK